MRRDPCQDPCRDRPRSSGCCRGLLHSGLCRMATPTPQQPILKSMPRAQRRTLCIALTAARHRYPRHHPRSQVATPPAALPAAPPSSQSAGAHDEVHAGGGLYDVGELTLLELEHRRLELGLHIVGGEPAEVAAVLRRVAIGHLCAARERADESEDSGMGGGVWRMGRSTQEAGRANAPARRGWRGPPSRFRRVACTRAAS